MRDKLRMINLRLTELSNYLSISRPTLYKYIEDFENENYENLNPSIRKIFFYIESNDDITKKDVITYIISILNEDKIFSREDLLVSEIIECLKNETSTDKLQFLLNIIKYVKDESFLKSLNIVFKLMNNRKALEDINLDQHFQILYGLAVMNKKVERTEEKLQEVKKLLTEGLEND
ncbi:hypothetical protein [Haloplasma contractile]|uniref:Uncharacterized protein n=1 Tax=Haloplasma contractile SSD-17B TaxID=1033810 RepID=F7Q1P5_9MOLU|nr:hypothetical protein [Haloplasma contractile]ERJ12292.1 hypothetical protein HLPCO_001819 [Haloplasma contractile SSD-17B]